MLANRMHQENRVEFSTKAGTLMALSQHLKSATILPLIIFTQHEWQSDCDLILNKLRNQPWHTLDLVVRSSAATEDTLHSSAAGKYVSVLNVRFESTFHEAVEKVIASFTSHDGQDQILIQPQLQEVALSGVIFTYDPNTKSPYYIINYDDATSDTTSVTAGHSNQKTLVIHRSHHERTSHFPQLMKLTDELESLLDTLFLDIEFAVTKNNELFLFQVRPLIINDRHDIIDENSHLKALQRVEEKIRLGLNRHPYLYGDKTVYGVMPDWNPAEIIGIRPKPLALTLYRELITDAVWAYQRSNYGYKNLRSFPLLLDFEGLPYIDARVSFNSFLPNTLPDTISEKLVNFYIQQLTNSPELHDKVEFDIVYSCYTLDLAKRLSRLSDHGFTSDEQAIIQQSLTHLTNQIIDNKDGLWKHDLDKINELEQRQKTICQSPLDTISKIYWLIEDCKRYGTLPFAGLARAGFIAVQILKSFIAVGILTQEDYANFIASVDSVSTRMTHDIQSSPKKAFLEKYGHLRPGTYDILSFRYDEKPDYYFDWEHTNSHATEPRKSNFTLSIQQLRKIQAHIDQDNLQINVLELLEFIKIAIESREYAKFIFTRSVSDVLRLVEEYALTAGLTRNDCAYLSINHLLSLYSTTRDPKQFLIESCQSGKQQYKMTCGLQLPPLVINPQQAYCFELSPAHPNFITQKSAQGMCTTPETPRDQLKNTIMFIPSADPGYDWIFTTGIAGFITQYGGVNSHMAIRAGELGLPAVIGCGAIHYTQWSQSKQISLDCANHQVHCL